MFRVGPQDFMGFLHHGWDSAMRDDQLDIPLAQLSPVWAEVGRSINLERPGLPCVRRIMGWSPLHIAAMEGDVRVCPCPIHTVVCSMCGTTE